MAGEYSITVACLNIWGWGWGCGIGLIADICIGIGWKVVKGLENLESGSWFMVWDISGSVLITVPTWDRIGPTSVGGLRCTGRSWGSWGGDTGTIGIILNSMACSHRLQINFIYWIGILKELFGGSVRLKSPRVTEKMIDSVFAIRLPLILWQCSGQL